MVATGLATTVVVEYTLAPSSQRRLGLVSLIADYSTTQDIPKILAIPAGLKAEEVTVFGVWHAPTCAWYALCDNPTAGGIDHPILGAVPTCNRCARKHGMQDQVRPLFLTEVYED